MQHRTHFEDADTDHIVMIDPGIPADTFMIPDSMLRKGPTFSVNVTAKIFFGRSSDWIRLHQRKNRFVLDGEEVGSTRTDAGYRSFSLGDVERMVYALGEGDVLNGVEMRNSLTVVRAIAAVHQMI